MAADSDTTESSSGTEIFNPYSGYLGMFNQHHTSESAATGPDVEDSHTIRVAPLVSALVHRRFVNVIEADSTQQQSHPQYGVLGLTQNSAAQEKSEDSSSEERENCLLLSNTAEPWSAFICGSQGSGKSHTLSCLLENSLVKDRKIGNLESPLTGIVFHYDQFSNFNSGQVCEAAYLCSTGVPVKVLVAPTSLTRMTHQYTNLPNLPPGTQQPQVSPLYFSENQLTVDVMMTLMAVNDTKEGAPLYISSLRQLLREMVMDNQGRPGLDYADFRRRLARLYLTEGQKAPLDMRLQLLQSVLLQATQSENARAAHDAIWRFEPGTLTIVDLSDQFISESDACAFFSICLKLFMDGWQSNPRIIALDEAHKFLTSSAEASKLTTDLVSVIRQQRHLSARVIVATQEPTVSGELLDLCNVSIIHRFSSPQWYQTLVQHLAGANAEQEERGTLFKEIVNLGVGEALAFCPTAVLRLVSGRPKRLQDGYVKLVIRERLSADGGQSVRTAVQVEGAKNSWQITLPKFELVKERKFAALGSLVVR